MAKTTKKPVKKKAKLDRKPKEKIIGGPGPVKGPGK